MERVFGVGKPWRKARCMGNAERNSLGKKSHELMTVLTLLVTSRRGSCNMCLHRHEDSEVVSAQVDWGGLQMLNIHPCVSHWCDGLSLGSSSSAKCLPCTWQECSWELSCNNECLDVGSDRGRAGTLPTERV